eukprot:gnl/MRDRNA2_/MRDRNA2_109134_c0_seq1.p1 gnl/MRDRNA2_/MRDRNA2_109134_c0~~gnl/MRDRNA2_/MRDRNA2_109134_c0_seq1.p1  ORF type:complete len:661 (+),score=170.52 gnl/MRDRNA2_/MRDRNA2_109134_c0_seq1:91-1983(+)
MKAMKAIKAGRGITGKGKSVIKKKAVSLMKSQPRRVRKSDVRTALLSCLKEQSGRADISFKSAQKSAATTQISIPIEERAGYPVTFPKGAVDPKDWKTHSGVKVEVDFARAYWLPDDWGQGVKITEKNGRSTGGGGGTLTTYVGPDMKAYFHRHMVEQYVGRKLTKEDGWNGQVRQAKLQARQAMQVARQGAEDADKDVVAPDSGESFFNLLSKEERANLPKKEDFHFAVVSARRAKDLKGVQDIYTVQSLIEHGGVTPTWYVDDNSVDDYKALGLQVVKGGKLTPSRNMALKDAAAKGKICVQVSDDISVWEYRDGKRATEKGDDAVNAAHKKSKRYIISPVAAAQFVIAKMRSAEGPKPKLGGCYMLGSCARTFGGPEFSRHHFILGDFMVVDTGSTVLFDENIGLKEDYDFTCAHITKYGSVMRCNRMTISVKHYDNAGGAVSNRNTTEEQRNIAILNKKWPGQFRKHPKRQNEVILKWKTGVCSEPGEDDDDDMDDTQEPKSTKEKKKSIPKQSVQQAVKKSVQKALVKCSAKPKAGGREMQVKKTILKKPPAAVAEFGEAKVIALGSGTPACDYITKRCQKLVGKTVKEGLDGFKYKNSKGVQLKYGLSDLRYDVQRKFIVLNSA